MLVRSTGKMAKVVSVLEDGVQLIGINRAEKRNCVDHETALKLIEAFETFQEDEQAKIAVLYGEGHNFCSGYDLSVVSRGEIKAGTNLLPKYRHMGPTSMKLRKPLIAAIEGYAVAGGLELALLADLRIASKSSTFGVFCRRVGVPLIDGGTVRLPRIIGMGSIDYLIALDMTLTGRAVHSEEALKWGLINRVVEDGKALSYAVEMAKEIISHPIDCMLLDRQSIYFSMENTFDKSMEKELESVSVLPQAIAGASKFMKKELKAPSKL